MGFLKTVRALPWYMKIICTTIIFAVATVISGFISSSIHDITFVQALMGQMNSALIAFGITIVVVLMDSYRTTKTTQE